MHSEKKEEPPSSKAEMCEKSSPRRGTYESEHRSPSGGRDYRTHEPKSEANSRETRSPSGGRD
jgi:hypothetical protein